MKYVVFSQGHTFIPVVVPECATHSTLQMEDAVPDSAGFFYIHNGILSVTEQKSDSLNLGPKQERDKFLLLALLNNLGIYSFLK